MMQGENLKSIEEKLCILFCGYRYSTEPHKIMHMCHLYDCLMDWLFVSWPALRGSDQSCRLGPSNFDLHGGLHCRSNLYTIISLK